MSRDHVGHADVAAFAADRVNLPKDTADAYRAQARRLRERLESYLAEHPDFTLRKMLMSGSLAKGTALRSLNDIDVACYISGADAPKDVDALLEYLAVRLRKAFPNFKPDQTVIMLVDEADALAQSREEAQMHHEDRAGVNALIRGIDRIASAGLPATVIMCANRLEALDPAVRRRAADVLVHPRQGHVRSVSTLLAKAFALDDRELDEGPRVGGSLIP